MPVILKKSSEQTRTLLIASNNLSKIKEFNALLGTKWACLPANELTPAPRWDETGQSYEENARIKARALADRASGICVLGEDSGISIDFLGGRPGIHSQRYMEERGGTVPCIRGLLESMKQATEAERGACFTSCIVFLDEKGEESVFVGHCPGRIATEVRGTNGFAWDCVFIPVGHFRTFGEMSPEEKHALSHRSRAVQQLLIGQTKDKPE